MEASAASLIATKCLLGLATDAERERLAAHTRSEALKVAKWCVKNGRLAPADVEDVAQDATIRAMSHVSSWRRQPKDRATSWNTYLNAITLHVVADYGRRSAREQKLLDELAGEIDNEY